MEWQPWVDVCLSYTLYPSKARELLILAEVAASDCDEDVQVGERWIVS